MVFLMESKKKK